MSSNSPKTRQASSRNNIARASHAIIANSHPQRRVCAEDNLSSLKHQPKMALDFLRRLASPACPLVTITALTGDKDAPAPTRTFDVYEGGSLQQITRFFEKNADHDIYFHPNTSGEDSNRKLKWHEIRHVRACAVDIDPNKAKPFKVARAEVLAKAKDALMGVEGPKASILINSGGGAQLLYVFDRPLKNVSFANVREVEDLNERLIELHGGDKVVKNVATLLRLPGTVNQQKGTKAGRPKALATFHATKVRTTMAELNRELPKAPPRKPREKRERRQITGANMKAIESALAHLDQESREAQGQVFEYDDWIKVAFALHHATDGSEDGFQLFDDWSATSGKNKPEENDALWSRVKDDDDKRDLVTIASVFDMAKKAGWQNPAQFIPTSDGSCFLKYPLTLSERQAEGYACNGSTQERAKVARDEFGHVDFLDDLADAMSNTGQPLIEGLADVGESTTIIADAGVGKTILMTKKAACFITGNPFLGREVLQSGVLYIAAEDAVGVKARLAAALIQKGWTKDTPAPLRVLGADEFAFDYKDPSQAKKAKAILANEIAILKAKFGVEHVAVFFDTLRDLHTAKENDNGEMQHTLKRLVGSVGGCSSYIAQHAVKSGEHEAGAGAIKGAVYNSLLLRKEGNGVKLTMLKRRHGRSDLSFSLTYDEIDIVRLLPPAPEDVERRTKYAVFKWKEASKGSAMGAVQDDDDEAGATDAPGADDDAPKAGSKAARVLALAREIISSDGYATVGSVLALRELSGKSRGKGARDATKRLLNVLVEAGQLSAMRGSSRKDPTKYGLPDASAQIPDDDV